ncbi:hypothetical protein KI387_026408, partial [Taxus chinensis]
MKNFKPNAFLVWVKLPNLALEFWEVEVLRGIVRATGDMLVIDPTTLARTRLVSTRMCVNVSPEKKMPAFIRLSSTYGVVEHELVYEHSPVHCVKCKSLGNMASSCKGSVVEWQLKPPVRVESGMESPNPAPHNPPYHVSKVGAMENGNLLI